MMRVFSIFTLIIILVFSTGSAFAGDLTLPYPDFKPWTPAYANSLDANFEALRGGVNDNTGKIIVNTGKITVNTGNIKANSSSITGVKSVLADHSHSPDDITPQGSGSGLDADMLDGIDATEFAASVHGHTPEDLTSQGDGSGLDADLLDGSDSSDFASSEHSHTDYALTGHEHDAQYAPLDHAHADYAEGLSDQEDRISIIEGYGDLSSVLDDISALRDTIKKLESKIAELENGLDKVSTGSTGP